MEIVIAIILFFSTGKLIGDKNELCKKTNYEQKECSTLKKMKDLGEKK